MDDTKHKHSIGPASSLHVFFQKPRPLEEQWWTGVNQRVEWGLIYYIGIRYMLESNWYNDIYI